MMATEDKRLALPEAVLMLGIGGMGMAPLAIYLAQAGCRVTGWDDNLQRQVRELLQRHGVELLQSSALTGQHALLVHSSAVSDSHPLYRQAQQAGARCLRRGEFLAEIAAGYNLLAVAGSHGKTTTTGMLIDMLGAVGFNFSYILGGLFSNPAQSPARFDPEADWLVAEIDESDGTIEGFSPEATLVVNCDWDHADHYTSEDELAEAFTRLIARTKTHLILPETLAVNEAAKATVTRFSVAGLNFNFDNANAALAACRLIAGKVPKNPLDGFQGICRRQDVLHRGKDFIVMADYAHHPTEISALLNMVKAEADGPVWVVFQPHRYTRTRRFAADFGDALALADQAWLLPVYAASEPPDEAGAAERIAGHNPELSLLDPLTLSAFLDRELAAAQPAALLFVGAGDIDRMARRFVKDRQRALKWRQGMTSEARLVLNEPLARKTTIGIGGPARYYTEPATDADVAYLLNEAREAKLPILPLGRGSNLIVADDGFNGVALSFRHRHWKVLDSDDEGRLVAGAGVRLKELCSFAAKHGLGGLEFLEGVPGTVGGSLRMNAGAMGGWIFDVVAEVTFLGEDGELHTWPKASFHVGYRECKELVNGMALRAVFQPGEAVQSEDIRRTMDTYAGKRKESQPRQPSAGCIFKNPEGNHAGKLIDELGLKGAREGGAEVSTVHANFIVNTGGATSADIIRLVRRIRETVRRERGIDLQPEVLLAGLRWEDVL